MKYKEFFKGKKITVMGLGLLGRGVNVAKFLAECGAELIVTDLKAEEQLASSLKKLARFKNIQYVLGEHRLEDFRDRDMVIKAAGVPLESPYIAEAKKNGIPIKMDASLFMEFAPEGVTTVGITGTRGKSTTTHLIHEILKTKNYQLKTNIFLAGNIRGTATLPLLKKVKSGDIVVLELDSWQLQGFGDAQTSPHVAVFTTFFDDHLNYYKGDRDQYLRDKANIFVYQIPLPTSPLERGRGGERHPMLILGDQAAPIIREKYRAHAERAVTIGVNDLPKTWKLKMPGEHNRYNAALALAAGDALGVSRTVSKKVIESFSGVPGRLEYVRTIRGIKIYNDTCATTPDATLAALKALGSSTTPSQPPPSEGGGEARRVVLIVGGSDKNLDMEKLAEAIPQYCKAVVLLSGTGTDRFTVLLQTKNYQLPAVFAKTLKEAVREALKQATKGDVILFSPAFASFGMFKNEFDRGDQFNKIVRSLR